MNKFVFGSVNDTDKSLLAKSASGKFGLNQGFITLFEFNDHAGKDGELADAVDITFQINDKEYRRRIYDVTRVYSKGNEITDTDSEEYIKGYQLVMNQNLGVLTHVAKALGVTQQQIDNKFKESATGFVDWCKKLLSLVPPTYKEVKVDCFLEYQWTITPGQDRTYVEMPKNMKGGYFLVKSHDPVGQWKEEHEWIEEDSQGNNVACNGLRYIDNAGNVHPFTRTKNYMESNKAVQQNSSTNSFTSEQGSGKTGWE